MGLKKTLVVAAIALLMLLTSGCLSDEQAKETLLNIELMGEAEQTVSQGNNTTFVFAVENNWRDNVTLEMSLEEVPDDWEHDFIPDSHLLDKNKGAHVLLNISVPSDADELGHVLRVRATALEDSKQTISLDFVVFAITREVPPEVNVVGPGDVVYLNYTGFFTDGSVFDTTQNDIGTDFRVIQSDVFQPRSLYEPQPFHPDRGELVEGFEEAIIGMRQGEYKSFFVPEDKAYSVHEEVEVNRTETIPLFEEWPTSEFQRAFRQPPAQWLPVTHRKWNWTAQVESISEEGMVMLRHMPSVGDIATPYGWDTEVISIDSTADGGKGEIVLMHHVEDLGPGDWAKLYNSTAKPNEYDECEILNITEDHVLLWVQRSHHKLAGYDLIFVVKVHEFSE